LKPEFSSHQRRWLLPILFIVVGILIYALLMFFKKQPPAIETVNKIWPVNVMTVKIGSHQPVLTVYGVVENPGAISVTASGVSYVTQLAVSEGQIVKPGDLLVALDQRDFLPKVQSSAAAISEISAQLANLKLTHAMDASALKNETRILELKQLGLSRAQQLKQRGLGSQVALDQAEQALQNQQLVVAQRQLLLQQYPHKRNELRAQLSQAQADHALAKLQLERSKTVSTATAIVGRVHVAVGDRVTQNQRLFSIYTLATMQVRAKLPAPDVSTVQSALISDHETIKPLLAHVDGADIELVLERLAGEADTRGIDALLVARTNARQLRTGMALTVYLNLPGQANSLVVPMKRCMALTGLIRLSTTDYTAFGSAGWAMCACLMA